LSHYQGDELHAFTALVAWQ